ncbi:uncharacterized protein LOC130715489 [Lotus japonicus]|uniref:uncharacterized protein LOC130715489 n=1 Tax=Lotus japonicus TaxID=34305 RepID=UPI0025896391|nr:uncharacterized protein LOC130715489 [Lotus japonicus]
MAVMSSQEATTITFFFFLSLATTSRPAPQGTRTAPFIIWYCSSFIIQGDTITMPLYFLMCLCGILCGPCAGVWSLCGILWGLHGILSGRSMVFVPGDEKSSMELDLRTSRRGELEELWKT